LYESNSNLDEELISNNILELRLIKFENKLEQMLFLSQQDTSKRFNDLDNSINFLNLNRSNISSSKLYLNESFDQKRDLIKINKAKSEGIDMHDELAKKRNKRPTNGGENDARKKIY